MEFFNVCLIWVIVIVILNVFFDDVSEFCIVDYVYISEDIVLEGNLIKLYFIFLVIFFIK